MRRAPAIAIAVAAVAAAGFALARFTAGDNAPDEGIRLPADQAMTLPPLCRDVVFEQARTIGCTVDPAKFDIRLSYSGTNGEPHGSVPAFAADARGSALILAMNAGMYHADMRPVGLYVEEGRQVAPLETADGEGNFYLKPNGVFFIGDDGKPSVMETSAFAEAAPPVRFATQSGPMLVVDGQIHPKFLPDGTSRYIRNGVGVTADGRIVFAITRDPVSLGSFARFFRDEAACPDALFFDGAVSSLWAGGAMVIESGHPAGPIVAVFTKDALTN